MGPSPPTNLFINYSSPGEFKSQKNRHAVSSFASKSYRPTFKKIPIERNNYRPFVLRTAEPSSPSPSSDDTSKGKASRRKKAGTPTSSPQDVEIQRQAQPMDERALGSPLADPFTSYPISNKPYVPFLIDYFIRSLTPRFSPALGVESSRYLIWFNVAMQHGELFHALVALSQVYYNIDVKGFGSTHWTALYHRGESLKQLRLKVESARSAEDDAAILTALWLMDVEAAHGDLQAYSMHKRAKERMVAARGGIRSLDADLQDELLKSEFFLPLLLYGSFVCELTNDDNVLVRFKESTPVRDSHGGKFQGLFSVLACKGFITTQAVEILQLILQHMSHDPRFAKASRMAGMALPETPPPGAQASNEMSRVLRITDEVNLESLHHRLLLALLTYIFNFHNHPQRLPAVSAPSSAVAAVQHPYLEILSKVALELSRPSNPADPSSATEREVTLWTMVAIGSASSFSPWRLEIPFMGHLIEWMENDEVRHAARSDIAPGMGSASERVSTHASTLSTTSSVRTGPTNLEKLTACLRGYYLYGADKKTLRSLQKWKVTDHRSRP